MSYFSLITALLAFSLVITEPAVTQQKQKLDPAYRLGLEYERRGDYERALEIFKKLLSRNPNNPNYRLRVEQNLKNLKRYEELINFHESQLKKKPKDISLLGKMADVYLKWGKIDTARVYFDKILANRKNNAFIYTFIANYLIQNRLFTEAIKILEDARKTLNNEHLFHFELARLYGWYKNYKASITEYLEVLSLDPKNYPIVEKEIMNLPNDSSTVLQVMEVINDMTDAHPDNELFFQIKAAYHLRHQMYDQAFNGFIRLDKARKAQGKQILQFANQTFQQGAYHAAVKAYSYVIITYPGSERVTDAEFGLGRAYEQIALEHDDTGTALNQTISESRTSYLSRSINQYRQIIVNNQGSEWAQRACFRIGEIQFFQIFDIDEAIKEYSSAAQIHSKNSTGKMAVQRIGDCCVAKGDLAKAWNTYRLVSTANKEITPDIAWETDFKMAEVRYYEGRFREAASILDSLIVRVHPNHVLYNNILTKSSFFAEYMEQDSLALVHFAKGGFLIRQHRKSQAAAVYENILTAFPNTSLADDCLYRLGELNVEMGNPESGIARLEQIRTKYPASYYAGRAHKRLGEIYAWVLHDPGKAMELFETFLITYPASIYIDDIRAEIRRLERQ